MESHSPSRPRREELANANITLDPKLGEVMDNVVKQRLQKLLNDKLSKRKSIQSLIRAGILMQDTSPADNLNNDRRDMYHRMSNHSLTEFLSQRPTLNQLVKANMVHDVMTWTEIKYDDGIIPSKRNCHQMVLSNNQNKLYLIGGYNTGSANMDKPTNIEVLQFDIDKNKWFRPLIGGAIPVERYSHSVVNINNNLIMFGGFNVKNKWLNDLHAVQTDYEINTAENNMNNSMLLWYQPETTGNAPTHRAAHAAAVVDKKMYIFGGNNGNKVFNDLYCLDTINMKWSKIQSKGNILPSARSAHTMTVIDNKYLIVFGGIDENGKPLNDIYIFDIEQSKWMKPKINGTSPEPRGAHSAVCINNNELFIFGGGYNGKILNDLHIFNVQTNQWLRPSDTGIIPTPRTGSSIAVTKDNVIYIFGGGNVQNDTDTLFNDLYALDTGYFTTDHKQLSQLIYAGHMNTKTKSNKPISHKTDKISSTINDNTNNGIDLTENALIEAGIISHDIANITNEVDNMISSVEYGIHQKIEQFRQKEEAYIMILRSIEAERRKLTDDIHKDISLLKFSVKKSMDTLQQNFIAKMLRKHVDHVNISDNEVESEQSLHIISENKTDNQQINDNEYDHSHHFTTNETDNSPNVTAIQGNKDESTVTTNGLKEQMACNQYKMMIQYEKQLQRFNVTETKENILLFDNNNDDINEQKAKRRKRKRRGRRRRKKNKKNKNAQLISGNNLINPQNIMNRYSELQNQNIYYHNLYPQYFPPPIQFPMGYNMIINPNDINYANNLYQFNYANNC